MILTIAISSMGRAHYVRRLLDSLKAQKYVPRYEILVGSPLPTSHFDEFPEVRAVQVAVRAGLSELRNELYRQATGKYVYFLDEDVEMPDEGFVYRLVEIVLRNPTHARGGGYLNPSQPNAFHRAYNSMSNLWLKVHQDANQSLPVAGNVIIPKNAPGTDTQEFPFSRRSAFGGEEIHLIENLRARGIPFQLDARFSVRHHCAHPPSVFYQRALLHGRSPRQPLNTPVPFKPVWRHFRDEKSLLMPVLVGSYMMTVWAARAWTGVRRLQ